MNEYLSLDKGEMIPYRVMRHMIKCPSCKKEIRTFARAEKAVSEPLKIPVSASIDDIRKVVSQIDSEYKLKKHRMSMTSWIIFGALLFMALTVFGILSIKSKMLGFVFYSSIAAGIVVYFSAFFAYNLDFFIKRLHMKIQA